VIAIEREGQTDAVYYIYSATGQLLESIAASGQRRYYHVDDVGTLLFLTGDNGTVTDSYSITPYGEVSGHTGSTDNPFTYLAAHGVMQVGDTGMYYMRARFFDAASARFLSKDPDRLLDPRAINPYQYAYASPLQFTDASGARVDAPSPVPYVISQFERQNPSDIPLIQNWIFRPRSVRLDPREPRPEPGNPLAALPQVAQDALRSGIAVLDYFGLEGEANLLRFLTPPAPEGGGSIILGFIEEQIVVI
jgi:RHS repeat-associated protein